MFLGRYEHTIDGKGRLAIPARYRAALESAAWSSRAASTAA